MTCTDLDGDGEVEDRKESIAVPLLPEVGCL